MVYFMRKYLLTTTEVSSTTKSPIFLSLETIESWMVESTSSSVGIESTSSIVMTLNITLTLPSVKPIGRRNKHSI